MADKQFGKGKDLLELESVQRAIVEAAQYAGNETARRLVNGTRGCIGYVFHGDKAMESPLEAIFYAWFGSVEALVDRDIYAFSAIPQEWVELQDGRRYRFDFLIAVGTQGLYEAAFRFGVKTSRLVVELDGHDFHERTKEQVAKRNERDRALLAEGWTVVHFSGSELYQDPLKCVTTVMEFAKREHDRIDRDVMEARKAAANSAPPQE